MVNGIIAALFILGFLLILVLAYFLKVLDWILIILAFCLAAAWSGAHKVSVDFFERRWLFAFVTVMLFYWVIKQYRRHWRNPVFWAVMAGLLTVHVAGFSLVLPHVPDLKTALLVFCFVVAPGEVFLVTIIVDKTTRRFSRHHRTEA